MIGLLVAVATLVCSGAVWVIGNQNTLKTDLGTNTERVKLLQEEVSELKRDVKGWGTIQAQLNLLQTRGSDAVQDLVKQVAIFANAIEAFRREGSPGERNRMDQIERRLSIVERDLDVHKAKDDERTGTRAK